MVVASLFGRNTSSSIPVFSLGFVSPVDVCPASSEHTLSPRGYELLFLSTTASVGENRSWRRMDSFYAPFLLLGYYTHVLLTATVCTSRSDRS